VNKVVRCAVSAALLSYIAWKTDWGQFGQAFAGLRLELWLAALGILLMCQVASARRWQVLARELRFERTMAQLLGYYLIGMYFSLLLPTSVGGDVMRAWYLDGGSGRKLGAFAAVLLDRLNGLLVLIAMACLAVALSPTALPAAIVWSVWSSAALAMLGVASLPVLQRLDLLPAGRKQQLATMLQALRAPRALAEATLWSAVVQAGNVVLVWLIGLALHLDVPLSYYFVFVPMVSLLTLLPISVAGTGVREESVAQFLVPFSIAPTLATTLSLLWFAVFAAAGLIGGAVYLCGAYPQPVSARRDPPEEPEAHGPIGRHSDQGRAGQLDEAA
jgi:hypothetical protein